MATVNVDDVIKYLKCKPNVADRLRRLNPRPLYVSCTEASRLRGYHPHPTLRTIQIYYGLVGLGSIVRHYGREILEFIPPEYIRRAGRRKYVPLAHLDTCRHFYYEAKEATEGG